jgi:hypothetical protein
MNSELYNKKWDFPEDMRKHMKVCFTKVKNADTSMDGYKRNLRLQQADSLGYRELKRIKNFFDAFKGQTTDAPFILNGENKMKQFVESVLSGARQGMSSTQRHKDDTGMVKSVKQDLKPSTDLNISPSKLKKNTLAKYDLAVTESLKRINEIMQKL